MNSTTQDKPTTSSQATPRRVGTPRYEVRETKDAFTITAFLPGVDRSSLETTIDGETLTVSGRRVFSTPAAWTPVHREIPQADYRLVLELDQRFNRDTVRAELTQGLLTLTLPKAEAVKPRRIEITG